MCAELSTCCVLRVVGIYGRVCTEVGTILLGQEHGLPGHQGSPRSCAIVLQGSFIFRVLVLLVILAELTVIIFKQYLVTESITELLKAVLNLDILITTHK